MMWSITARFAICATVPLLLYGSAGTRAVPAQFTVFVATVGTDTLAVDRFSRGATGIEGVLLLRKPFAQTVHYKATLAPTGRFTHTELVWRDAKGTEFRSAIVSFGVDSIRTELKGSPKQLVSAPPRLDAIPLPTLPDAAHAYSMLEHTAIVLLAPTTGLPKEVEWIVAGTRKAEKRPVRRIVADTVEFECMVGPVRAHAGADKRILWMSVGSPPGQVIVKRSESDVDIAKLLAEFARRDAPREGAPRVRRGD